MQLRLSALLYSQRRRKARRCLSAIKKILDMGCDGCRVIASSHHEFSGYLLRAALGLGLPATIRWSALNCSVTHIRLRENRLPEVMYSNDISHLKDME